MNIGIAIALLECTLVLYEFVGQLVLLITKHRSMDDAYNYMNLSNTDKQISMTVTK